MIAEHLVVLAGPLSGGALDPVRVPRVEVGATGLEHPLVGDVADEHVAEAEGRFARHAPAVRLDQLLAHERVEEPVDRHAAGAVDELDQRAGAEGPPDHSARLRRGALGRLQAVDAGGEEGLDGRRQRQQ